MKSFISLFTLGLLVVSCQTWKENSGSSEAAHPRFPQGADVKLSDYQPYKYEVLFTDPVCGPYKYKDTVKSVKGKVLTQKPENVYCRNRYDLKKSGSRPESPQYHLVEWINDTNTKEIFFTYLSFSNKAVSGALCEAAKRGVKIKFALDSGTDLATANQLIACSPENIQFKKRGNENGLGFAHNKIFIINPNSKSEIKIVFSSGNMTSGPVMHHENWNFITTNVNSYFAQSHLCVMRAEWDEVDGRSRDAYIKSIRQCRNAIQAPEESDIKAFFIPGEGEPGKGIAKKTASEYMLQGNDDGGGIENAAHIWIGVHRFFYNKMVDGLKKRMASKNKPDLRIIADDDTYYKANDPDFKDGDTMPGEWYNMRQLRSAGAKIKFMETNSSEHQLHHSKYLIFANDQNQIVSVLTGSANLTGAGFKTNWENIYYVQIPEVLSAFAEHYSKTWNKMATEVENLPAKGNVDGDLEDSPAETGGARLVVPPVIDSAIASNDFRSPQSTEDEERLKKKLDKIWDNYCVGNRDSAAIAQPNYASDEVISAAKKLAMVSPYSYYFYSGPLNIYGLKKGGDLVNPPDNFPEVPQLKDGKKNAHAFLTVLCGEFRDRPTLIRAKIKWVNNMVTPTDEPQKPIDVSQNVWSQMSANSYASYMGISAMIYTYRRQQAAKLEPLSFGGVTADHPVEPFTICETKFIFKNYIEKNSSPKFTKANFAKHDSEYEKFKSLCGDDDLNYYYDFRGDSNFKPNSPESNGMIWFSSAVAKNCFRNGDEVKLSEKGKGLIRDSELCQNYFKQPFAYRWNAARAGLAAWLFHNDASAEIFSNEGIPFYVIPHTRPDLRAFSFSTDGKKQIRAFIPRWRENMKTYWKLDDMGFNSLFFKAGEDGDSLIPTDQAYTRLRNAVNRHTDWYAAAFKTRYADGTEEVKDQAYSPFVASSYVMQASDQFTSPGVTVKSPTDGCKQWMFVFKIRKDQWYSSQSIADGKAVDLNQNWFDETSLGTNSLAKSERAMDRLGTATENELDSIIYLHNIQTDGTVKMGCGLDKLDGK